MDEDLRALVAGGCRINHGCPASTRPKSGSAFSIHRNPRVEAVEEVAADIQRALESNIPPKKLAVGSDCGFGRQGLDGEIAIFKTRALAQAADVVRPERGAGRARSAPPTKLFRSISVSARPADRRASRPSTAG